MKIDEAIKIIADRLMLHRDVAEAHVRVFVDLGMLALDPTQGDSADDAARSPTESPPPACEPEPEHRGDNTWHWLDVPAPDGKRRSGCFEWMGGHWWPSGRQISPEIAAKIGWRYVRPALDQPVVGIHERQAPTPAGLVPPNKPARIGGHLLRDRNGAEVAAVWIPATEQWMIDGTQKPLSPDEAASLGYEYIAAVPEAVG